MLHAHTCGAATSCSRQMLSGADRDIHSIDKWKKLGGVKNRKLAENILGGKLPRNAWHRMRQFCTTTLFFLTYSPLLRWPYL